MMSRVKLPTENMSVDTMKIGEMSVDKVTVDELSVDRMTIDRKTFDVMSVHKVTRCQIGIEQKFHFETLVVSIVKKSFFCQ